MGIDIQHFRILSNHGKAMRRAVEKNANLINAMRTDNLPSSLYPTQMLLISPTDPIRHGFYGLAVFLYDGRKGTRFQDVMHARSDVLERDVRRWMAQGLVAETPGIPIGKKEGHQLEGHVAEYVRALREGESEDTVVAKILAVGMFWAMKAERLM